MIRPGLLAVLSPCGVGLGFRVLGYYTGQTLLGAKAVAGLLMFSMVAGERPSTLFCTNSRSPMKLVHPSAGEVFGCQCARIPGIIYMLLTKIGFSVGIGRQQN